MQPRRRSLANIQPIQAISSRATKDPHRHKATEGSRKENIGAMVQVADGLRLSGRYEEAENMWRQLLADFPDQPQPYVGLGVLLSDLERHTEAYDFYKKAVTIAPGEFVAWRQFGHCLYNLRQYEPASTAFKKSIALKPTRADTYHDLGRVFFTNAQPEEALACFDKAIELKADYAPAWLGKGEQLQVLGREIEAKECFHKAIKIEPDGALPHFRLASMDQSAEEAGDLLRRLEMLSKSSTLPRSERVAAHFSSANILHAQEDYATAFEHYRAGNEALKADFQFDRVQFQERIDHSIEGFAPQAFETHRTAGSPSQSPIFIVGMPCSGISAVEAIISSHPEVHAGGEERKMADITDALELPGGALSYPRDIAEINPAHLLPFGTQYLSHMARLHSGAKRFTDKLPFNCLHLGLIAILFPNSTIIHCTRDPIETCLSCYFQNFEGSHSLSFTNSLSDLGAVHSDYQRMMEHWRKVLPIEIFDVKYEDLIGRQEEVSRAMLAHARLEWDYVCLSSHEQTRAESGASPKAGKMLHPLSAEKWPHYERHLAPLQETLGKGR